MLFLLAHPDSLKSIVPKEVFIIKEILKYTKKTSKKANIKY